MNDYNAMPAQAHRLELIGRERLVVSGVEVSPPPVTPSSRPDW